jgi:hypothetical protein
MRGRTTGILIVSFTLLSSALLLGALTSASSPLSRIETTTTTSSSATGLHELTFIQEDLVGHYTLGWVPWSVTLSNGAAGELTESNPSNTTILPWPDNENSFSNNQSLSTITFLVPYGFYSYEEVTAFGAVFGQVDFSQSNPFPVDIGTWFPHPFMP